MPLLPEWWPCTYGECRLTYTRPAGTTYRPSPKGEIRHQMRDYELRWRQ